MKLYKQKNQASRFIKNLKKSVPPSIMRDTSGGFLRWGEDNRFPFQIIQTIRRSITGKACSNTFHQYVYGNGFNDTSVALKLDKALFEASRQLTNLNGFCLLLKFNLDGYTIASVTTLPYECTRLGLPDDEGNVIYIVYNPEMGLDLYRMTDNEKYPIYDFDKSKITDDIISYGDSYKGHVVWFGVETEFARFYPCPFFWGDTDSEGGGSEAMIGDYLLGRLLSKELGSGFLQNVLLKMIGDPDAPITEHIELYNNEKSYTTVGDAFSEYLDAHFSGIEGDSMMVLWSKIKDQMPEVTAFPANFNYENLSGVVDTVRSEVATAWGVPLILANIATSGSLSKDDIKSATQLMHGVVRPYQMILERTFGKIIKEVPELQGLDASIENYNVFPETQTIDPIIWAELNAETKQKWIKDNTDIEIVDKVATTKTQTSIESDNPEQAKAQAQLRGSVGGVQGILQIADNYQKGIIDRSAAITILEEIYGFKSEIAEKILGSNKTTTI